MILKDFTPGHVEALTINKQLDRQPVGDISQFLFPDANIIENAIE